MASLILALGLVSALQSRGSPNVSESTRLAPFRILMFRQVEHTGKLEPELAPSEHAQTEELLPASPAERTAIPTELSADDRVFMGSTFVTNDRSLKLVLVEPSRRDPYLFADVNLNGVFDSDERFIFAPFQRPDSAPVSGSHPHSSLAHRSILLLSDPYGSA